MEFRDTDAAGIAHFSSYVLYMEQAEHEFLRHLGFSVQMVQGQEKISWPRVSVRCDYRGMVRFEDWLDILVRVVRLGAKSVTYGFQFFHEDKLVAEGEMTSVCCRFRENRPPESMAIPDAIRAKLATACPATSND